MQRRVYVIDGGYFDNKEQFFARMAQTFSVGQGQKIGRNLDAFNDLLRGGFGQHEYGEPIHIIWKNVNRSRWVLGRAFVEMVCNIILDTDESGHDCTLELD